MAPKALGATSGLILVDADVLIDFQRGVLPCRQWMISLGSEDALVPGSVALEMVVGSRSKRELDRSVQLLVALRILWHSIEDNELAWNLAGKYSSSAGLSLADYLVAAQALNQGATLYTFNLKHFGVIPELDVRAPYVR